MVGIRLQRRISMSFLIYSLCESYKNRYYLLRIGKCAIRAAWAWGARRRRGEWARPATPSYVRVKPRNVADVKSPKGLLTQSKCGLPHSDTATAQQAGHVKTRAPETVRAPPKLETGIV